MLTMVCQGDKGVLLDEHAFLVVLSRSVIHVIVQLRSFLRKTNITQHNTNPQAFALFFPGPVCAFKYLNIERPKRYHKMVEGDIDQLLLLLDRYLFLRGDTITSHIHNASSPHPPIKSETGSNSDALDKKPVALQYFAATDLDRHLEEIAFEQKELNALTVRISAICLDTKLVARTKKRLVADFAIIRPDDVQSFSEKRVADMLATLRATQQQASAPAAAQTFKLTAVASISYDGSPENLVT